MKKLLLPLLLLISLFTNAQTQTVYTPKGDTILFNVTFKAFIPKVVTPPVVIPPVPVKTIRLSSLTNVSNKTITITQKTYTGKYIFTNLNNVVVDFNGSTLSSLTRVIELKGFIKKCIFKNVNITGTVKDYAIVVQDNDNATAINIDSVQFTNVTAINTNQVFHSNSAGLKQGIIRNVKFDHWVVKNSPNLSSAIEIRNGCNINISDMLVDNVNGANDNHNGIFFIIGSVNGYNCKYSNGQGNLFRLWPFSHGDTTSVCNLYNNTILNSRKYGAFEVQADGNMQTIGFTGFKPANVNIFKNFADNIGTEQSVYAGLMLDLYPIGGGIVTYHDNTGSRMYPPVNKTVTNDMINYEGGTAITYGNTYKQ